MAKHHKNSRKSRQQPPQMDEFYDESPYGEEIEEIMDTPRAQKSIESIRPLKASSSAAVWILLIALFIFAASAIVR